MAARRSFKSYESFLEKLSMGAIGTRWIFEDLKIQGHNPIELERGTMSYKIWKKVKIKRVRVPDLLCLDCGRRIESRAKTRLKISMSHSLSDPKRGWDYALDDRDFVALVVCERTGEEPVDWKAGGLIQYINVKALREAYQSGQVIKPSRKGAREGFEMRVVWPAAIANASGEISEIDKTHIKYKRKTDKRTITYQMVRKGGIRLNPLVKEGQQIMKNQILASVVPVSSHFPCDGGMSEHEYINLLNSSSLSERYTAAKALAYFDSAKTRKALAQKTKDHKEHIYVKLEASASLARLGEEQGWKFIGDCLSDEYLQNRLETVIALGEIKAIGSSKLLIQTLQDREQHPEIRGGAAWALGELEEKTAIEALMDSFDEIEEEIRIEAARALARLAEKYTPEILEQFPEKHPSKRPGVAWALSKGGKFTIGDLANVLVDEDARQWVSYMIGTQERSKYIHDIEALRKKDPEVYFAATVLWKIMTSWIYGLKEY